MTLKMSQLSEEREWLLKANDEGAGHTLQLQQQLASLSARVSVKQAVEHELAVKTEALAHELAVKRNEVELLRVSVKQAVSETHVWQETSRSEARPASLFRLT
jgi:hypothetical protein